MRREFDKKTKVAAFERSRGHCESCTAKLWPGRIHYDHRIADALGGEPTLDNCDVLCRACHDVKTHTADMPAIARAKRVTAKHIGAETGNGRPLAGTRRSGWKRKIDGTVERRK